MSYNRIQEQLDSFDMCELYYSPNEYCIVWRIVRLWGCVDIHYNSNKLETRHVVRDRSTGFWNHKGQSSLGFLSHMALNWNPCCFWFWLVT